MTKKDYEVIAKVIASICYETVSVCTIERERIAGMFAIELAKYNPRFNEAKFLEACKRDNSK